MQPLPRGLKPMLAVAGTLPRDDDAWAYEVKWDGVRALVAVEGGRVTLVDLGSKNGTFVDEARVERRELRAGDAFRCGEVRFKLMAARAEVAPLHVQELRTRLLPASVEELVAAERVAGSALTLSILPSRASSSPVSL